MMLAIDFPPKVLGGEGRIAYSIAKGLVEKGIDLVVVAPKTYGHQAFDETQPFLVKRVPVLGNNFITRIPTFFLATAKLILNFEGDLIYSLRPVLVRADLPHLHHFHTTRIGLAKSLRTSDHPLLALPNYLFVPFDRYMLKRSDQLLVCGQKMVEELKEICGNHPDIRVLSNGIDSELWPATKCHSDHSTKKKILYVGRLDRVKGLHDLFTALTPIMTSDPDICLTIIGRGPLEHQVKYWAQQHAFTERVSQTSWIEQSALNREYGSHDLLVVPSRYEPFGLVVLEGMLSGVPVLSSTACAQLGQETFEEGNVEALEQKIKALVSKPEKLHNISVEGRKAALNYTRSKMIHELEQVLLGLTSKEKK